MAEGISDKISDAVDRVKNAATGDDDERGAGIEGQSATVREALKALGEGEVDRFLEALAEDVEWIAPEGSKFPGSGTHRGRDAVRKELFDQIESGFPAFGYRPAHYLEAEEEEMVVTLGSFVGEGSSGEFDVPGAVVWELEHQSITRVRIHSDSDAFPQPVKEEEKKTKKKEEEEQEQRDEPRGQEGQDPGADADDEDEASDGGAGESDSDSDSESGSDSESREDEEDRA
jgi:ketosteroid isomerase-like protein